MAKRKGFVPDRGDLVLVNFSPQTAHEQAGQRPALVISPAGYNAVSGLAFCCPVTRTRRSHPFEVLLPTGLKTTGVVLVEQLRSLAWQARGAVLIEKVPDEVIATVAGKVMAIIADR